jgi:hypothetical protein
MVKILEKDCAWERDYSDRWPWLLDVWLFHPWYDDSSDIFV